MRFVELSQARRLSNPLNSKGRKNGQGQNRTADTRIFSPLTVPGLRDTMRRYLNRFNGLTLVLSPSFSRLEPIVANGSGKVVAK
jgi:hypothetical protein